MGNLFDFSDSKMEARRYGVYSLLAGLLAIAASIKSVLHLKPGPGGAREVWMLAAGAALVTALMGILGLSISGPASCADPRARKLSIIGLCMAAVSILVIGIQILFHV